MANATGNAPAPVLSAPGPFPVGIPEAGTSSFWDRLSNWASENKGVVYTIAGVTLVVGAGGAIYYFNSSDSSADGSAPAGNKRKKQRERRREKERAAKDTATKDEPTTAAEPKKATVASTSEDELPEVDESTVGALSEEVQDQVPYRHKWMLTSAGPQRLRSQAQGRRQQGVRVQGLQPRH